MLNINNESIYKKLPALNLAQEVNEICLPLFRATKANYFDYCRIYNDNTLALLTSDSEYLTNFLKNKYPLGGVIKQSGKHLWDSYYYNPAIHDARVNFNHDHGISIFNKKSNYVEYFDIAAPRENREIVSIYLNNFDLIESSLANIIDHSSQLIKVADKQRIMISNEICDSIKK